jgi:2-polyprenyl-3-methyl-5-hydroxy-6-metoxy-1,4-benzoquinol methylase
MAEHVCPVWIGYLLASPLRKLFQSPEKILGPYIEPGMTVMDVGCAMGFFSLPAARLVGPKGRVVCIDLQPRMLEKLKKRARKAGLGDRIEGRTCSPVSLDASDLQGRVDFALAFAVVHEVPEPEALMRELFESLAPGGRLLLAEPKGHISEEDFTRTLDIARAGGFEQASRPDVRRSLSALMVKPA